jgi:hypothetical protein
VIPRNRKWKPLPNYAWSNHDPKNEQMTAVLEVPPVKNSNDAVKGLHRPAGEAGEEKVMGC